MNHVCVVFPGQGSQNANMLDGFSSNEVFVDTLKHASNILGYNISEIVGSDKLGDTLYTQPIIVAVSIAIWRAIQDQHKFVPIVGAGHSLGEYTAMVAAEVLTLEACLGLVSKRAELMTKANENRPTLMAAIIGLDRDRVAELCKEMSSDKSIIEAVNYNSSQQTVIGGDEDAISQSLEIFKKEGAKLAKKLDVSLASHTSLMKSCSEELHKTMINMNFMKPKFEIIQNYDASSNTEIDGIIDSLSKQVYSPVKWVDSINKISKMDIEAFLEIGPGKVLSGLIKRIDKKSPCYSLDSESTSNDVFSNIKNG